jgi:hypothetical protein
MAKSNKRKWPSKLFAKLTKVTRKVFDKDPTLKRPYNEVQKWVSKNIYAYFKGQNPNKVKITDIQKAVQAAFKGLTQTRISQRVCGNVFAVPDGDIDAANWWEVQDTISRIDPFVQVRVNGGAQYGRTQIDVASNIKGDPMIQEIVEDVRRDNDNASGSIWEGIRKLIPNMPDDGNPCNYFIDFVLNVGGVSVDDTEEAEGEIVPLSFEQKKVRLQRQKEVEKAARERSKARKAKERERPKTEKPKPEEKIKVDKKDIVEALKLLKEDFKEGIFTKEEYKKERAKLIDKLEKGGEV